MKELDTNKMLFSSPARIEEIKTVNDDWIVEGYPSTFDNVDRGDDVVRPGAFTETLKSGPKVRLLLAHDPGNVLGVPLKLHEDKKGLFGSFKISKTSLGTDTHQLLLDGAIDSFSIGYRAKEWGFIDDDVRELKRVELYEVSLVPIPMNPQAVVTRVKQDGTLAERVQACDAALKQIYEDLRGLVDHDRPLNESKRQELMELLETFSGLDDVRSNLQSVLTVKSPGLVEMHQVKHQLAELRKRRPDLSQKE